MGALQDIGSSITGSIHKAMLCVRKPPKVGKELTSNIDLRAALVSQEKIGGGIQSFKTVKTTAEEMGYHVMQVKYNPSQINISTQAGSYMQAGPGDGQVTQITSPAKTIMSVDLIFDDVSIPDAFMFDKLNISAGAVVSDVAGIVKQVKQDGYSVQAQMDGLIGMITQRLCRKVVFYWSEMAFAGEVTSVNAKYTMFNPTGHPIRGVVSLSICQSETDLRGGDKKYWDNAFNALFGKSNKNNDISATNWTDTIGNILNF